MSRRGRRRERMSVCLGGVPPYRTLSSKEEEGRGGCGARARSDIGIDTDNETPTPTRPRTSLPFPFYSTRTSSCSWGNVHPLGLNKGNKKGLRRIFSRINAMCFQEHCCNFEAALFHPVMFMIMACKMHDTSQLVAQLRGYPETHLSR